MPLVRILSNVKLGTSTVDINHVLKTISKSVATVFDSPERVVMIDLELDKDMCFQASTDVRSHTMQPSDMMLILSPVALCVYRGP